MQKSCQIHFIYKTLSESQTSHCFRFMCYEPNWFSYLHLNFVSGGLLIFVEQVWILDSIYIERLLCFWSQEYSVDGAKMFLCIR